MVDLDRQHGRTLPADTPKRETCVGEGGQISFFFLATHSCGNHVHVHTDLLLRAVHAAGRGGQLAGHLHRGGQPEDAHPDQRAAGQPGRGRPADRRALHVGASRRQRHPGVALRAGHLQGQHVCPGYV